MVTRDQEFQDVRRLLDFPKEQRPSSDLIVSGLIRQEQFMMNRLNGSGQAWSPATVQLTTVAGQEEYSLYSNDPTNTLLLTGFGKALFAYREPGSEVIVPIPFTDFVNEFSNQSYEIIGIPYMAGEYPAFSGEKMAFYRTATGAAKIRFYPSPTEARAYKIVYATGALDWESFEWTDTPLLPEWSHMKCLATALFLLAQSEWANLNFEQNRLQRGDLREGIEAQYRMQNDEFEPYIRNPHHDAGIDVVGAWYE